MDDMAVPSSSVRIEDGAVARENFVATGRGRDAHWLVYLFAAAFVARYIWLV